jgi:hypothetical protein
MQPLSRRTFLTRASLTAAGIGVASVMPELPSLFGDSEAAVTPATEDAGTGLAELSSGESVVAHISNVSTGELNLYVGERQIPFRDPALVAKLLQAVR